MRRNEIRGLLATLAFGGLMATGAEAQEEMAVRSQGVRPYTVELKPLPTALTAVPEAGALGSFGLGGEVFLNSNVAWFFDGTYVDVNVPNNLVAKASGANPSAPVINWQNGYELLTGARFYSSAAVSSWYGEAGVGYSDLKGDFAYEDTDVQSHVISVLPTVTGGYRWLFSNNILIRLGAGVAANAVQSRTATAGTNTTNSAQGEYKVRNLQRTPVLAQVDFGLGYAF